MGQIMTPEHDKWKEFCERLEGKEGCNFQEDENKEIRWECKGGTDKSFSIAILNTMPNIDIKKSIEYFENHGGYCDCEILLNVVGE